MGAKYTRSDFEWSYTDEPHATRRALILKKYPQIKKLMIVDKRFKWIVIALVFFQILMLYIISHVSSLWILFVLSYFLTGVLNHTLMLAIHEIAHNQAFGPNKPLHNRIFSIFANLPIGFPLSITFKKYHLDHHRYQGDDVLDVDLPSQFEAQLFTCSVMKFIWLLLQPIFYGLRPLFLHPKPPTFFEIVNYIVQISFDVLIAITLGWKMVFYMIFSSLIGTGVHPMAGHFISEHYVMFESNKKEIIKKAIDSKQIKDDQLSDDELSKCELINGVYAHNGVMLIPETCSYYGPLNLLSFNVGYHVEHHDFPSIPGTLLPEVRRIASEFYDTLNYHTSLTNVLYRYVVDPELGPYSRVKRVTKESKINQ